MLDKAKTFFSGGGRFFSGGNLTLVAGLAAAGILGSATIIHEKQSRDHIAMVPLEERLCNDIEYDLTQHSVSDTDRLLMASDHGIASLISAKVDYLIDGTAIHTFGDYKVDQYLASEIVSAAKDTDFPVKLMFAMAEKESSFKVDARAHKGSALGLMQFINQSWLEAVRDHGSEFGLSREAKSIKAKNVRGKVKLYVADAEEEKRVLNLRKDPYLSMVMAARRLQEAQKTIEEDTGVRLSESELYFPHFLGTYGTKKLFSKIAQNPKTGANKVFPRAARYNKRLFVEKGRYITVQRLKDRLNGMIEKSTSKYRDAHLRVLIASNPEPERPTQVASLTF